MDLARVEATTTELVAAYSLFLSALSGRYLALRAAGVPPAQIVTELRRVGYSFARSFLDAATERVRAYPASDANGALKDALDAHASELIALLKSAVVRNIKQVEGWALQGQQAGDPFVQPAGAMGLLWQQKMAQPEFTLPDAIGRNWVAEKMVRAATRDVLYQAELDATVVELRAAGFSYAMVMHPSAHDKNGMILSLAEQPSVLRDFPRVDDPAVRKEVFHPNARATLEGYHRVSP